mgnify:CR=1 FL=1
MKMPKLNAEDKRDVERIYKYLHKNAPIISYLNLYRGIAKFLNGEGEARRKMGEAINRLAIAAMHLLAEIREMEIKAKNG